MNELYDSVELLPFDNHGWFLNADPLRECLKKKPARVVIEIGCWLGFSTRFIAHQLPEGGRIYAIDTWLGSEEHKDDPRLPFLYQQFLSNVKHAGLTDKILPIRMHSLEAAKALNILADLIYIDASHDEESVYQDILHWHSHLAPGGILCGDDLRWESVWRGVVRAAEKLNRPISGEDNFWKLI